jgi:Uma2 family endonuclease
VPACGVLLVAEVLSAQSASVDRSFKARLYARAGIPSYWIVDPHAERVTLSPFELGTDGVYTPARQTDELVTLHQPWAVTLDLPAWTAELDEIRRAAL